MSEAIIFDDSDKARDIVEAAGAPVAAIRIGEIFEPLGVMPDIQRPDTPDTRGNQARNPDIAPENPVNLPVVD